MDPRSAIAWVLAALLLLGAPSETWGSEAELEEAPAPESVEEAYNPFRRAIEGVLSWEPLFPQLRAYIDDLPPFFADTRLDVHLRTYYFNRLSIDDERSEAWAAGGSVRYRSGWWEDLFSVEAALFTSQRVLGKKNEDGTKLLEPGQKGFTVLGTLNGKLRWRDHYVVGYRQELRLPFVNRQDNRMVPNTFEGITLRGRFRDLEYFAGYLWRMKPRDADDFDTMSEVAGVEEDRGLGGLGALWTPCESFSFGAIDYYVDDLLNILYSEASWQTRFFDGLGMKLDVQFTDQLSVGRDLLTGRSTHTYHLGVRASTSLHGALLAAGFTTTGDEGVLSPWGSDPSFVNRMQANFGAADEEAWFAQLSYHFDHIGFEGLSVATSYTQGWDRNGSDGASLPHRREVDVTLDYRVPGGLFRGLWVRVRGAVLNENGAEKTGHQVRVILNYEIPLF